MAYITHVFMSNSPFFETRNQASIVRMSPELIDDLFNSIPPATISLNQSKGLRCSAIGRTLIRQGSVP